MTPRSPAWPPPCSSRPHDEWQIADRRYLSEGSMALLSPISDNHRQPKEVRRATAEHRH
jgi:hypothetical protein